MNIDLTGPVAGVAAVRRHVHRIQRAVIEIGPDMQRLIFSPVMDGINLVGSVTDRGRSNFSHLRNFPGTVFQRLIRNGAGILVEIDQLRFPLLIQFDHQTHTAYPVIGEVRQLRIIHIVGAAVKQKDGGKAPLQGIADVLVCPQTVVHHGFHIIPVFRIPDKGFQIRPVGISHRVGSRLRRHTQQKRRSQTEKQQITEQFLHRINLIINLLTV